MVSRRGRTGEKASRKKADDRERRFEAAMEARLTGAKKPRRGQAQRWPLAPASEAKPPAKAPRPDPKHLP